MNSLPHRQRPSDSEIFQLHTINKQIRLSFQAHFDTFLCHKESSFFLNLHQSPSDIVQHCIANSLQRSPYHTRSDKFQAGKKCSFLEKSFRFRFDTRQASMHYNFLQNSLQSLFEICPSRRAGSHHRHLIQIDISLLSTMSSSSSLCLSETIQKNKMHIGLEMSDPSPLRTCRQHKRYTCRLILPLLLSGIFQDYIASNSVQLSFRYLSDTFLHHTPSSLTRSSSPHWSDIYLGDNQGIDLRHLHQYLFGIFLKDKVCNSQKRPCPVLIEMFQLHTRYNYLH